LPEYPANATDGRSHVEAQSSALAAFGNGARNSIEEANELGDLDTADLCAEVSRGIDKWLWFDKLNIARAQRKLIFRAPCKARRKAEREADFVYSRDREPKEYERRLHFGMNEYLGNVRTEHSINQDQVELIDLEAKLRRWPNYTKAADVADASVGSGQTDNDAFLSRTKKSLTEIGRPLATRKALHRELCLAGVRAEWEADRLYPLHPLPDHWQEQPSATFRGSYGVALDHEITSLATIPVVSQPSPSLRPRWPRPSPRRPR